MKDFKIKVVVMADGRIVLNGVPVIKGQHVEVTLRVEEPSEFSYPLRGLPVHYEDPFEPAVEESEWNAAK